MHNSDTSGVTGSVSNTHEQIGDVLHVASAGSPESSNTVAPRGARKFFNNAIRAATAGIAARAVVMSALGPAGVVSAAAINGPLTCSFQTVNGHYITAVGGGGGRITDTIHSDATRIAAWETFRVICARPVVAVPYVIFDSARTAGQEIAGAGLVPVFTGSATQANSWVNSQSPAPGTLVPEGSTVTLVLRTGPVP